jgi:hypothetical protein
MRARRRERTKGTVAALAIAALVASGGRRARADAGEVRPTFDDLQQGADPRATFDANRFEIVHIEETSVGPLGSSKTTWWRVTRGVYRMPTLDGDFYRALGRADLAAAEESRRAWSAALYWGGVAAVAGGLIGAGWEAERNHEVGALVALGFVVPGFVSIYVGSALTRPALDEAQAQDLARRYDDLLARHLGVAVGSTF